MDINKGPQHPSGLAVVVALASLLTAVVVGAINFKLLPPSAFWICAFAFVVVAVLFMLPWMKSIQANLVAAKATRRIRRQYREDIRALCNALRPLSQQSVVFSVGNILNAAINHKLLSNVCVIAYQVALSALFERIEELRQLSSHLSDAQLMGRLHSWLQAYIRICEGIGGEIKNGVTQAEFLPGIRDSFLRDWMEIYQRANAARDEYCRIGYGIRAIDPRTSVPEYLSPVPSLTV
jgi:hypothetical protein